jgi:hypothetical protein
MGTILVLLVVLVAFALAAMRWGYVSSDGPESQEWQRREHSVWQSEEVPSPALNERPAQWQVIAGKAGTTDDDCTRSMCA